VTVPALPRLQELQHLPKEHLVGPFIAVGAGLIFLFSPLIVQGIMKFDEWFEKRLQSKQHSAPKK
jgi:hypothetical protein